MFRALLVLIIIATLGAYLTRPNKDDAEDAMRDQLMLAIAKDDLHGKSAGEQAALLACRLDPSVCYDLIRTGIDIAYDNRWLYGRVDLDGFGKRATCYGLFTTFVCPGGLRDA